jgi:hypothetical protein
MAPARWRRVTAFVAFGRSRPRPCDRGRARAAVGAQPVLESSFVGAPGRGHGGGWSALNAALPAASGRANPPPPGARGARSRRASAPASPPPSTARWVSDDRGGREGLVRVGGPPGPRRGAEADRVARRADDGGGAGGRQ